VSLDGQSVLALTPTMRELGAAGIAFDEVTGELLDEGVRLFGQSFDSLLAAVEQARSAA